jgi:hypothetical protein
MPQRLAVQNSFAPIPGLILGGIILFKISVLRNSIQIFGKNRPKIAYAQSLMEESEQ